MMPSWREMQSEPGSGASASAFSQGHHASFESLATQLENKDTIHLNSTPEGGGVAEILSSLIPLSRWHGLGARWMVIPPNQDFFEVTRRMHDYLQGKPGNFTDDEFVNAFQTAPDVMLQKSTREGFGLTVTEAMWKGQAVIGGDVGGIRLQIKNGETGFLVSDVAECADRLVELLTDAALRENLGAAAHASVEENYLLPRLMHDYWRIVA